jgi:Sulfotransferase domain
LGRTGTTSLKVALEQLLDGRCYHLSDVVERPAEAAIWRRAGDGDPPDWDALLSGYTATVDWPAAAFWAELSAAYPEAIVLLSWRDADGWWESVSNTIFQAIQIEAPAGTAVAAQREMILDLLHSRFTLNWDDEQSAKLAFARHNDAVRANTPPERLVEWRAGDGWEPLCTALDLPVPDAPYPHVNTTAQFRLGAGLDESESG